jgi:hypothetical protein
MTHAIAFFFFSFLAFHSHANRLPASRHDLVPTTPRSALYVAFFFFRFLAFALACVVCITLGQAEQAAGPSSSNRHGECDGLSSTKWQPYVRSAHRPPRTALLLTLPTGISHVAACKNAGCSAWLCWLWLCSAATAQLGLHTTHTSAASAAVASPVLRTLHRLALPGLPPTCTIFLTPTRSCVSRGRRLEACPSAARRRSTAWRSLARCAARASSPPRAKAPPSRQPRRARARPRPRSPSRYLLRMRCAASASHTRARRARA